MLARECNVTMRKRRTESQQPSDKVLKLRGQLEKVQVYSKSNVEILNFKLYFFPSSKRIKISALWAKWPTKVLKYVKPMISTLTLN